MLNVAVIMLGTFANNKMNKRIKRYALNVKRNRYIATLYSSIVLNAKSMMDVLITVWRSASELA